MLFSSFFWNLQVVDLLVDDHLGALINEIKQLYHISISHPDASVAGWSADFVLMFCAVNVDKPLSGIDIVLLQAVEP